MYNGGFSNSIVDAPSTRIDVTLPGEPSPGVMRTPAVRPAIFETICVFLLISPKGVACVTETVVV